MGYKKERVKLEKLLVKVNGINNYNDKSFDILQHTQEEYSHTIRILKNKEPEVFMSHYTDELQAIKVAKKTLKESVEDQTKEENFTAYKDLIVKALQKSIDAALAIV